MDGYEEVCDGRLWMMGLEGPCRRVLGAMPAERRARFEVVTIVSWQAVFGEGDPDDPDWEAFVEEQAQRAVVYGIFTRRLRAPCGGEQTWSCTIPFTEHLLRDETVTALTADLLLRHAERWFADREAEQAATASGGRVS